MKLSIRPKNAALIEEEYLKDWQFDELVPAGNYRRRKKRELSVEEHQ